MLEMEVPSNHFFSHLNVSTSVSPVQFTSDKNIVPRKVFERSRQSVHVLSDLNTNTLKMNNTNASCNSAGSSTTTTASSMCSSDEIATENDFTPEFRFHNDPSTSDLIANSFNTMDTDYLYCQHPSYPNLNSKPLLNKSKECQNKTCQQLILNSNVTSNTAPHPLCFEKHDPVSLSNQSSSNIVRCQKSDTFGGHCLSNFASTVTNARNNSTNSSVTIPQENDSTPFSQSCDIACTNATIAESTFHSSLENENAQKQYKSLEPLVATSSKLFLDPESSTVWNAVPELNKKRTPVSLLWQRFPQASDSLSTQLCDASSFSSAISACCQKSYHFPVDGDYESDQDSVQQLVERQNYHESWSHKWTMGIIRFCKYVQLSDKIQIGPPCKMHTTNDSICKINVLKKLYNSFSKPGWPQEGVRLQIECSGYRQDILAWSNLDRSIFKLTMPIIAQGVTSLLKRVGGAKHLKNGHQPFFNACRNALKADTDLHEFFQAYSRNVLNQKKSKKCRQFDPLTVMHHDIVLKKKIAKLPLPTSSPETSMPVIPTTALQSKLPKFSSSYNENSRSISKQCSKNYSNTLLNISACKPTSRYVELEHSFYDAPSQKTYETTTPSTTSSPDLINSELPIAMTGISPILQCMDSNLLEECKYNCVANQHCHLDYCSSDYALSLLNHSKCDMQHQDALSESNMHPIPTFYPSPFASELSTIDLSNTNSPIPIIYNLDEPMQCKTSVPQPFTNLSSVSNYYGTSHEPASVPLNLPAPFRCYENPGCRSHSLFNTYSNCDVFIPNPVTSST